MASVTCPDITCVHNEDTFCHCESLEMEMHTDINWKICVVCKSYKNRGNEDVGND